MDESNKIPRPMRFWELLSAFRSREDLLRDAFASRPWPEDYLSLYENRSQSIHQQDRGVLDAPVPWELSRSIAARFDQRFQFDPHDRTLRTGDSPRFASAAAIEMTALQVHDQFGGAYIEEVFESGSTRIPLL
jgi:hypothetical protein